METGQLINAKEASKVDYFKILEHSIFTALETYTNVHRGSGIFSRITTDLYEASRDIILDYLGLEKEDYVVVFCTISRASRLFSKLSKVDYVILRDREIGLSLGVTAVAIKKKSLSDDFTLDVGGGTVRLTSTKWVIWSKLPDRLEGGTPAIINVIAFAKAIQIIQKEGRDIFKRIIPDNDEVNPVYSAHEILYDDKFLNYTGKELLQELSETMTGNRIMVPTIEGLKPYINLDNGASTPSFLPVWETYRQMLTVNDHIKEEVIGEVKLICQKFLKAPVDEYEVIFTSNTTEAINLAARWIDTERTGIEPVIVTSYLEHISNDLPWRKLQGFDLLRLSIDDKGYFDYSELEKILIDYNVNRIYGKKRIELVAISGASNVLGAYNNLNELSETIHKYGARILVDAAQLVAHRAIDIKGCNIDYLAFSAHKAYAPFGTGTLIMKKELVNQTDDELTLIRLSGEENAGGIAALGKAILLLQRIGMDVIREEESRKTARLITGIRKIKGITIFGIKDVVSSDFQNKGGVVAFNHNRMFANKIGKFLSFYGIGIRNGCHCSHILIKQLLGFNPRLEKLQSLIIQLFPKMSLPGVARVSLGIENTDQDIDTFLGALTEIVVNKRKPTSSQVNKQMDSFTEEQIKKIFY
jgi:selenocysteine lyase/cysteine desulfurase